MKNVLPILMVMLLIAVSSVPGQAAWRGDHGWHGGGHFGGGIWIGPGWWGPPYYPYYPYYPAPPVVIERETTVYRDREPQQTEQPYWYYCTQPQGYYPYVRRCPSGWLKVVPSAPDDRDSMNNPAAAPRERSSGSVQPPSPREERY